jgi:phage tail sheath protein FI
MPTYLHPGVYVEEIPSGSKPIEGVATSVAAFVGKASRGPVGDATLVQSFDDYNNTFGDIVSEDDAMGLAVQSFYLNGGKAAFICRLAGEGSTASSETVNGQDGAKVLKVSATSKGEWGNKVYFRIIKPDQDSLTFTLEIGHHENGKFVVDEEFQDIGLRADDNNYALTRVNGNSAYVELSFEDAADLKNAANQYQAATLTGGELDTSATYFSANITGAMNLTLNINNLGAELITINAAGLALEGDNEKDAIKVAGAIQAAVRALSVDVAHKSFECKYNKTAHRFELISKKEKSASSLEVYGGDLAILAKLLRLDANQRAELRGKVFGSATAEDKFSNAANGLPSLTQPMEIKLNIDNHGEFTIKLKASVENKPDEIALVGDKEKDAESIARAIQDAVQAYNPGVAAYKNFTGKYLSNQFVLSSGSGYSRQSSMAKAGAGPLADFLRISTDGTAIPGRQVEQGTAKLIPIHELGTLDEGVKLAGGTEIDPTANDYTDFYDSNLRKVRDVSIIVLPGKYMQPDGSGDPAISATLAHCEKMKNRMLIVDPPPDLELDQAATVNQLALPSSTYTALYYPWVKVANPFYNAEKRPDLAKTIDVAPSAFAAGMWARIDGKRGVWKAPAGMEAGLIGAAGLQYLVEDGEQDQLNPLGVNCFRNMPGGGRVIWGTRTLATKADPEWRYVPVRRTAIMIEQSIFEGIQWAVFEPNDHRLWSALRGNIGNFMNGLFRVGAFQGEKASDAYFVRCGLGDTMTQGEIDAGQVIVIVGFAPLKPAEFVIVRIQQKVNQQ